MPAAAVRFGAGFLVGAAIGFFAANAFDRTRRAPVAPPVAEAPAQAPAAATPGDEDLTDEELRRAMSVVDSRPNDYEANLKLAEFLLRIRNRPADAVRYYTRASQLESDAVDPLVGLGDASLATALAAGRPGAYDAKLLGAAVSSYQRALKIDPKNEFAQRGLAAVERAKKT